MPRLTTTGGITFKIISYGETGGMYLLLNKPWLLLAAALLLLVVLVLISWKSVADTKNQALQNGAMTLSAETYYVSSSGLDDNDGRSADRPFQTIQKAVDLAQAGDTVKLAPGVYQQDIITRRDGQKGGPVTINGPPEAVVIGGGADRVVEVNHNYIKLEGFTIDGHFNQAEESQSYRDKLIYVQGKGNKSGVRGLQILKMTLKNAGGECIRLRYFARDNEISGNSIQNCGIEDFRFNAGGKNGEGIYIGTATEQLKDGKNPTTDPDQSNNNWIHDNRIDTQGNECVDIKEASSGNMVENNYCIGQKDPESGGMDARGSGNTFRNNQIAGNLGAGVRLGGDSVSDGINNNVYNNVISNNQQGGIKLQRMPQGKICANSMSGNQEGEAVGTFRESFQPTAPCSG